MVFRAVSSVVYSCLPSPKVNQLYLGLLHRRRFERPDSIDHFDHDRSCVLSDYLVMFCTKGSRVCDACVVCHAQLPAPSSIFSPGFFWNVIIMCSPFIFFPRMVISTCLCHKTKTSNFSSVPALCCCGTARRRWKW